MLPALAGLGLHCSPLQLYCIYRHRGTGILVFTRGVDVYFYSIVVSVSRVYVNTWRLHVGNSGLFLTRMCRVLHVRYRFYCTRANVVVLG